MLLTVDLEMVQADGPLAKDYVAVHAHMHVCSTSALVFQRIVFHLVNHIPVADFVSFYKANCLPGNLTQLSPGNRVYCFLLHK